ncbi:type VI secretion system Vgr family protein [Aquimarina longa]|uniref:type VI secretion system Vgr family protein n=1 Tax=Aquimarina longa TaxID=1080221 RepID=UPI0007846196|nr:phage baseplate assembly protein V [Aquimarina longa]
MALQTTTSIYLSSTPLHSYLSLKIEQQLDAHHDLELVCRADVIEQLSDELVGASKEYLGGIITVQIQALGNYGGYKELEFKGVVTKVRAIKGSDQQKGNLIKLHAKSSSILADNGAHFTSYSDVNLSEILERTFQGYDVGKLETSFAPRSSETIHYSVQHNQSAFSYASRLAAYHNEWFYYNGKQLIFGSPSTEETELSYGVDLQDFSIELDTVANATTYISSDYLTDELHQKSSKEINIPSEGYHGFMDNRSKTLYHKPTQASHSLYTDSNQKSRLDTQVEQHTIARAMKQVIARGVSDNPSVALGALIRVQGYGRYRIIGITHTNTEHGVYHNEFTAVEASFDTYPHMDLNRYPQSDTTVATVMDNADPENLGRIRVQFPWQKAMGTMTPWLRMITPHGGSEKGFHFLPEKKEQVMVGFENRNAESPFILGALYSGTANPSGFATEMNDIKIIKTRSGHTLEFNDTKGGESITIMDTNGNTILIDTVNNNMNITALETMTFNAKNIKMIAEENVDIQAKREIKTASEGDTLVLSKGAATMQATGDTTITSDASVTVEARSDTTIKGVNTVVEGQSEAKLKGQQTKVQGQMTTIQGASGKTDYM